MPEKVLIIEDTRSFALLVQKLLLDTHGYVSDIAYSKKEAQVLLEEHRGDYFTAIVDLNLPDATDGEAADMVIASKIPVIVFTGNDDHALKDDLWERGIADYATKGNGHSLDYITWIVNRIYHNSDVEVLVVDDSITARKVMSRLLKTQRFQVHTACSAKQALAILDQNPNLSVAIIDCFMKEMNGFELASKMRDQKPREELEIIGVSSQGGRTLSAQFIKSGANDFLIKPFIPEEFLCRVSHAVDRVENFNELKNLSQTKNQLLGTAAHDIRGPVGAISTAADYILRRNPPTEKRDTLLNMIKTSSTGLLELLSDLLDTSAIESGELNLKIKEENITKAIEERMSLYLAEAEAKSITVELNLEENMLCNIDVVKMRQTIDNLLTNAIKYSPLDGHIVLELKKDKYDFVFSVSDTGPGIEDHEIKELFTPFKVLSSQATGGEKATGLGLAIAKNIVEAHKGRIEYCQSPLGGAMFIVRVPLNL